MFDYSKERIWAEVNLDHLAFTYRQIQKMAPGKKIMPVIKADAYGHGAVQAAKTYKKEGAGYFAVATAKEAIELRDAGIKEPVLILAPVTGNCVKELISNDIELCVPCMDAAEEYKKSAGGGHVKIHAKIDSGMGRLGFSGVSDAENIASLATDPSFIFRGIFTHFAASGERDKYDFTMRQHKIYSDIAAFLQSRGIQIPMLHCANSDAIVNFPEFTGNYVRPGIILYGYASPSEKLLPLKPALSLLTRALQVKWVEAGSPIGYSCTWTAQKKTKVATLSAGYADGLPRSGSGKLEMIAKGVRVPIIGRVCMDMCMIDVTEVPDIKAGDVVTVVGEEQNASVWMDELAEKSGTIPHEPLTQLTKRVRRYYISETGAPR